MSTPRWRQVMIHHSAGHDGDGLDVRAIQRLHVEVNGWRDIGYHFVVEQVMGGYCSIAARPLYLAGAHCPGVNATAIGVCLLGNFERNQPPTAQLEEAARLVAGLCAALSIPPTDAGILAHRDRRATLCPGKWLDMDALRARVRLLLATR